LSTKRKTKKKSDEKMWIYAVIAVVTVLVVFALIKILGKKPQTVDPAGSSDVSLTVSVPSTEQSNASEGAESSDESDAESKDETSKAQSGGQSDSGSQGGSSQSPSSSKSNGDYINYTVSGAAEADQWYLQIASVAHPLPEGFVQPSTTVIDDIGREIDSRIVGAYWDLVNAAKADGLNIYPISGFRPHSTQVSLFNARVEQARNDGYADPEAEAARHVARPGTSEHELGLAVDFNSVDEIYFRNTAEAKWLAAHCAEYGFVIRYPEDKESVTGIIYEPWHLRFVGVKHAKRMNELNMCLEEYCEYIKSGNS
jgi:D-alanyl-D-alanine carboxypeptidase